MSFNAYWKYGNNWMSNTRWIYSTLDWLETKWYKAYYGIQNLWIWLPVVWRDRDWDWSYLNRVMRFKLLRMADGCEKYSYHLHKNRDVKQMRIVAELLRRMDEHPYYDNADVRAGGDRDIRVKGRSVWAQHIETQENQDMAYFLKMMGKMRGWWW
jgi:hypothetical protein